MPKITIKPIVPKKLFPDVGKLIVEQQRKEARNVQREYERTVKTWRNQPDFEINEKDKNVYVETNDKVYGYVDKGTKPHTIKPKRPGYPLRFNSAGFKAKTAPNRLDSRAGRAAQPPTISALAVKHPGFPARRFTVIIRERSQKRFKKNFDKALRLALARKG